MMRSALLALALAAAFAGAATDERAGVRVSVAAWNIAWFGDGVDDRILTGNRNGRHLREAGDLRRLREIVAGLGDRGVEVVALQEIENEAAARRLFPEPEWAVFVSRRETDPKWAQRTAIAVSRASSWRIERHPDLVDWSPIGRDRHGVDVTLSRGDERVRVLSIHFQAGCARDPLDSGKRPCGFLRMQFAVLRGWLHERLREGVPVVVAGDWNRAPAPGDEAYPSLPGNPLILPPPGSVPNCWPGFFESFVDHLVAFAPPGQEASASGVREVLHDAPVSLRDRLSDHCPVVAEVSFGPATP